MYKFNLFSSKLCVNNSVFSKEAGMYKKLK